MVSRRGFPIVMFSGVLLVFSLVAFEVRISSLVLIGGASGKNAMDLSSTLWLPPIPNVLKDLEIGLKMTADVPISKHNNPFFRAAVRDPLCHGCRVDPDKKHCGSPKVLLPPHRGQNLSALTLEDLPEECRVCLECPERDHWYGRFDEAAPPTQLAYSHFLPSIPDKHRFPHNVSSWLEHFRTPGNAYPDRIYFTEYNPSIVRIPEHQIPHAFRDQGVVYLASFRVTTLEFCHQTAEIALARMGLKEWPGDRRLLPAPTEYTGLALLREGLEIVSDAVFYLKHLRATDIRLFVLHNELYISPGDSIYPIWLVPTEKSKSAYLKKYQPVFSSDSWITPVLVGLKRICPDNKNPGKNIQFFVDPSDMVAVAEIYPGKHKVALDLERKCPRSIVGRRPVNISWPKRSFGTVDEVRVVSEAIQL